CPESRGQERRYRLLRAAFDDRDATRDLARIRVLGAEAVVIGLFRRGHGGIAELDDAARDDGWRLRRTGEDDRNRVAGFDPKPDRGLRSGGQLRHRRAALSGPPPRA